MARNRTIYQSEGLYVGPSPSTGVHFTLGGNFGSHGAYNQFANQITGANLTKELLRVQTANYSYNIAYTDINQFNQLSAIDRVILEQPTVSLDFSYILFGLSNEKAMGFTISSGTLFTSAISGILNKTQDEKNYFILTVPEGNDSQGYATYGSSSVVTWGIGNGFITSYTSEGSVGNFPQVTVNVEALNMKVDPAASGRIPAVNPVNGTTIDGWYYVLPTGIQSPDRAATINTTDYSISALRPGDITLSLGTEQMGASWSDMKIQNYSLSFDLSREPLQKLGSKYAFSREISFPVTVSLNVTADIGDVSTGNLSNMIDNDPTTTFNPIISIVKPGTSNVAAWYQIKGAKLESMEISASIGPNKSVTLNFSSQLGGPQDLTRGLFMSGMYVT
jgi:hypothetical protein